jgi:hypothetical protein
MVTSAATVGAAGLELPQPTARPATATTAARPIVKRNFDIPTSEKIDMKPDELIKASDVPDSSQRNREGMCEIRRPAPPHPRPSA